MGQFQLYDTITMIMTIFMAYSVAILSFFFAYLALYAEYYVLSIFLVIVGLGCVKYLRR